MEEKELRNILSSNIKKGRTKANLSQMALAERIKISANYLSNIERCRAWVSPVTIVKLAHALNVEPYELFQSDQVLYEKEKDKIQSYVEENKKAVLNLFYKLNE